MEKFKVNINMEQTFTDGEKDKVSVDTIVEMERKEDKLYVNFEGREMIFQVGETHLCRFQLAGGEILLNFTTCALRQIEDRIVIEYEISDFNRNLISNNILKMRLKTL